MRKYIYSILAACIAITAVSCSEDADTTTLKSVNFQANIEATPGAIVLTPANKYQSVLTVSWPKVLYPVDAPVTYALQFDVASDTIGATAWSHAIRLDAGSDVLSKSFMGGELNDLAKDLGLPSDTEGQLVVRVEASLDRAIYSPGIAVKVTPFTEVITLEKIYMPGAYQGWNPATAATLDAVENGVFKGYITFPAGQLEFKFTTGPGWDQFYGNNPSGVFAEGGDTNLSVPAPGSYEIMVNLNTLTYTATPYTWGVIGTATPGGWDSDTDMSYDYVAKRWTFTGNLVSGALKFRLNDSWNVNYGPNSNDDTVVHFDNPGAYTIPDTGNYTVTFALDPDPATAHYTVQLN